MTLYTIDTGFFKLDGGAMFGVVPKTLWYKLNPSDDKNLCTWAMRCLLIEQGDRLILVDTGIGNKQSEKFFSHFRPHGDDTIEKSLAKHGFGLADITDVLLTHLHFDHVGGAVTRLANGTLIPTFPNATYWSNEAHWQTATVPNAREKASFLKENFEPIKSNGQLQMLTDGADICEGVHVKFVYGHTEAMMLPHIQYKGKEIIYMADLIPSAGHIRLPYIMAYDMQPLKTLAEKEAYLPQACAAGSILFFEHDRINECCSLKQTERGVTVDQLFKLEDW